MSDPSFTDEQKEYLAGFAVGAGLTGWKTPGGAAEKKSEAAQGLATAVGPDRWLVEAHERTKSAGRKLVNEEVAKGERHPLDRWDEIVARAEQGVFPKGVDVFLTKTYGMFYVAPAQNTYMCRMRLPGGAITSHQLAGVADLSDELAGGYAHVTTRANLQLREIPVDAPAKVVTRLADLGIVTRGSGADNLRNITASPTSGFDPQEYIDAFPIARELHHYILNHREMYHLPRKFNVAFDGGGVVTTLADTNDVGFAAVRVEDEHATAEVPAGVYFRVELAGITGHRQFASDVGWLIEPSRCVAVAAAVVRVFVAHGDRTDRKKARLKYLIDSWGMAKFLAEVKKELPFAPIEWPAERCTKARPPVPGAHVGFHPQAEPGKFYVGVVVGVGTLTSDQMRALARIAERHGRGTLRLTCWQNVLIPHLDEAAIDEVKRELEAAGLDWRAHAVRAGLVACTGNAGCKFAASDTKRHALAIAERVENSVPLDRPVNIHVTGCHHSCAQHYIGDIGLIGAKVRPVVYSLGSPGDAPPNPAAERDDEAEEVEGYHVFLGGGFGDDRGVGREFMTDVPAAEAPAVIERVLRVYLEHREAEERFVDFSRRMEISRLRELCGLASSKPA